MNANPTKHKSQSLRGRAFAWLCSLALPGAAAFAAPAPAPASPSASPVDRPDVVFVLIDDLRWNAMSCLGHPFLQTPNIDRLRERGALLSNAFCTTSLCSPSRASFLTGAYASRHGVIDNTGSEYDPDKTPIYPQVLQAAGYRTALIGKWHMGTDAMPRRGFDYWLSFYGQGVYNNPELNENGHALKRQGYTTDLLTDYAIGFIETTPVGRPYCLILSHKAVHEPFELPARHKGVYPGARLPEPASYADDFAGKPVWQRRQYAYPGRTNDWRTRDLENESIPDSIPAAAWPPPDEEKYVDQLRLVKSVDENVGRLLAALEKRGTLDRTLIVFAGDNGYHHFEHRRHDKRVAYDESLRIPFLISYPGRIPAGSTFSQTFANVDWAETLLDYLNLPVPSSMQGRSYRPVLENRAPDWDNTLFYEYWRELVHATPTVVGVRTPEWKFLRYPEEPAMDELYRLGADPYELRNAASDPALKAVREDLAALLEKNAARVGWSYERQPSLPAPHRGPELRLLDLRSEQGRPTDQGPRSVAFVPAKGNSGVVDEGTAIAIDQGHRWEGPSPRLDDGGYAFPIRIAARILVQGDGIVATHNGPLEAWTLFVQDSRPGFGLRTKEWLASSTTLDGPAIPKDTWVDLSVVVDRALVSFYVDGTEVASTRLAVSFQHLPKGKLALGEAPNIPISPSHPKRSFKGLIQTLRIDLVNRVP